FLSTIAGPFDVLVFRSSGVALASIALMVQLALPLSKILSQRSFHRVSSRFIRITDQVKLAIEEHAVRARPSECCGLLSGKDSLITDMHPLPNGADRPETRYFATPEDLFAAMRRIREANQALLGIYHSHPR